jgi:digeranylgeranylglycerophospholipid reductase
MNSEQSEFNDSQKHYDVIIVGASFAGLAVAAQLRNKRVLVLDRKPIGTGQTSACGIPLRTLQALGLEDAVLQIHNQIIVHTPGRDFVYPLPEPFCTFDYSTLCQALWQQADADFVQAAALDLQIDRVKTSQGIFYSDIIVDASGWRAVLARRLQANFVRQDRLNYGIETSIVYPAEDLHFWYDPDRLSKTGIIWAFPASDYNRMGFASYSGEAPGTDRLDIFLADLDLDRDTLHGGYLPHALREPVVDNLFLVGDAAGHCLGLTGEGIRPALFFGTRLGSLLHQVLDNKLPLSQAQNAYNTLVDERSGGYTLLCRAQRLLPQLPMPFVKIALAIVSQPKVLDRLLRQYMQAFSLSETQSVVIS